MKELKASVSVKDTNAFKQLLAILLFAYENASDDVKRVIEDRLHTITKYIHCEWKDGMEDE
ncbi:hypothetical protein [Chengkuizengella axinellae]|uniref:Uncharacterized protein n=1 Tax=Chengkuizengella axinellae TaxID=3064388 RepID=A0ABT9IXB4_9BACL|nr:hypothetical protein [Chengkuizengella sp. 2205SS18-9]MDP5274016.1 hypothetical protein [Chengkuizengella sp. 2205SS18-9]